MNIRETEEIVDVWNKGGWENQLFAKTKWLEANEIIKDLKEIIFDIKDVLNQCNCGFDECSECSKNSMAEYSINVIKSRFIQLLTSHSTTSPNHKG